LALPYQRNTGSAAGDKSVNARTGRGRGTTARPAPPNTCGG